MLLTPPGTRCMNDLVIDHIFAFQTRPLRQKILRPHQTVEEVVFEDDHHSRTVHFGAFLGKELVGICSVYKSPFDPFPNKSSFRLRGMAVDLSYQGKGYGRVLLEASIKHAQEKMGDILWCTARISAKGFYAAHNFRQHGPTFEKPHIGPHVLMYTNLT